jgi:hypothetical protein
MKKPGTTAGLGNIILSLFTPQFTPGRGDAAVFADGASATGAGRVPELSYICCVWIASQRFNPRCLSRRP